MDSRNFSPFQEDEKENFNSKEISDFEMHSSASPSLEKTLLDLKNWMGNQKKLDLKEQKKQSFPLIQNYINSAKTINHLMEIYQHLNWDTDFSFLKANRHQKFDAVFKAKPAAKSKEAANNVNAASTTWKNTLTLLLEKNAELILSKNMDLANESDREHELAFLNLVGENLTKDDIIELLNLQKSFFTLISEDKCFLNIFNKYKNHSYRDLNYLIALQNIYYFVQDNPSSNDPLLDPLRYILAITYDEKFKERGEKINKLIYSNSYKQISLCIREAESASDLNKIVDYLKKDEFNLFKNSSRWNLVKTAIQKQADLLGVSIEIDKPVAANMRKK